MPWRVCLSAFMRADTPYLAVASITVLPLLLAPPLLSNLLPSLRSHALFLGHFTARRLARLTLEKPEALDALSSSPAEAATAAALPDASPAAKPGRARAVGFSLVGMGGWGSPHLHGSVVDQCLEAAAALHPSEKGSTRPTGWRLQVCAAAWTQLQEPGQVQKSRLCLVVA